MIRECFIANTGIQFQREAFTEIGLDPSTLYPFVVPRPPPLVATASAVAKLGKSAHAAEATDGTLTNEAQASQTAADSFKAEESEELADAVCPLYDQLKLSKPWWVLEVIPLRLRAQNRHDAMWVPYWRYVSCQLFCCAASVSDCSRGVMIGSKQGKYGPRAQSTTARCGKGGEDPRASFRKDKDGGRGSERREVRAQGEVRFRRMRVGGLMCACVRAFPRRTSTPGFFICLISLPVCLCYLHLPISTIKYRKLVPLRS